MSKNKQPKYYMRQCTFTKPTKDGVSQTTSWIPEEFAKLNKYVKLKNESDEWIDGWQVISVSENRRTYEECNDRSQDYKNQAKASDIKRGSAKKLSK
jgi:hypothetical protein